jgi:hypothetical protein
MARYGVVYFTTKLIWKLQTYKTMHFAECFSSNGSKNILFCFLDCLLN